LDVHLEGKSFVLIETSVSPPMVFFLSFSLVVMSWTSSFLSDSLPFFQGIVVLRIVPSPSSFLSRDFVLKVNLPKAPQLL